MKNGEFYPDTIKPYIKALGLYSFTSYISPVLGGFMNGELIPGGGHIGRIKNVLEQQDKMYLRNELKVTYHYILSYYPITL